MKFHYFSPIFMSCFLHEFVEFLHPGIWQGVNCFTITTLFLTQPNWYSVTSLERPHRKNHPIWKDHFIIRENGYLKLDSMPTGLSGKTIFLTSRVPDKFQFTTLRVLLGQSMAQNNFFVHEFVM